jgi:ribosomal protein L24
MKKGDAVKVVWGAHKGLEAEITAISGKNVTVMLAVGFEAQLSTDHIEEINEVTILTASQAANVKVGQMFKRYSEAECNAEAREVLKVERRGAESVRVTVKDGKSATNYMLRLTTKVYVC